MKNICLILFPQMSTAIIIAVLLHVRGEALKEKNSRILPTDKGNIIPIMNPRTIPNQI